eukprot:CAMPEP_0114992740 /NCGR_PEP_ID=MMETSP0216-20121206/12117_1 /TAXON_ID=223996 /ORGANISM="Protocruzia adherens, Strain Boccale" /LENGTH=349 /DNA_ID=CAMNT_0002356255 /DNA_START=157 /DNA_END=1206 /DNA_ORIENTATION=+
MADQIPDSELKELTTDSELGESEDISCREGGFGASVDDWEDIQAIESTSASPQKQGLIRIRAEEEEREITSGRRKYQTHWDQLVEDDASKDFSASVSMINSDMAAVEQTKLEQFYKDVMYENYNDFTDYVDFHLDYLYDHVEDIKNCTPNVINIIMHKMQVEKIDLRNKPEAVQLSHRLHEIIKDSIQIDIDGLSPLRLIKMIDMGNLIPFINQNKSTLAGSPISKSFGPDLSKNVQAKLLENLKTAANTKEYNVEIQCATINFKKISFENKTGDHRYVFVFSNSPDILSIRNPRIQIAPRGSTFIRLKFVGTLFTQQRKVRLFVVSLEDLSIEQNVQFDLTLYSPHEF